MNAPPFVPCCEICIDSVAGALAAEQGGAHRVELCGNLVEGGTTPSAGMIRTVVAATRLPVMAMVRPRGGHFWYDVAETRTMLAEAEAVLAENVAGIVVGALLPDGQLDLAAMEPLVNLARSAQRSVTFHRAFDQVSNPWHALEQLIDLGIDRILTSGQAPTAEVGIDRLKSLSQRAAGRISIMPGCGVNAANVRSILAATGAREIHFSGAQTCDLPVQFWRDDVPMSATSLPGDQRRRVTSAERVREICQAASQQGAQG